MTIMTGWKITFGDFIGSTYAFNRLKEMFDQEFQTALMMDDRANLYFVIEDEEKITELDIKNMFFFIKGYCMAHKQISFHPYRLFQK